MNLKQIVLALIASLSLAACSTTAKINSDYDPQQDFSGHKTFSGAGDDHMTEFGSGS